MKVPLIWKQLKKPVNEVIEDIIMKYALFLGCNIPARVEQYDFSARAVLKQAGVQLVDNHDFNCCGYPMRNADQKSFLLCSACPYCHLQFDTVQKMMVSQNGNDPLASVLYPQLLGLCMGIDEKALGININQLDISGVTSFFDSGVENAE